MRTESAKPREPVYHGERHKFFMGSGGDVAAETHAGVQMTETETTNALLLAIALELQSIRCWGVGQDLDKRG